MSEAGPHTASQGRDDDPVSIEQVLAAEAEALHGKTKAVEDLQKQAGSQAAQDARKRVNADDRGEDSVKQESAQVHARDAFYVGLNKLNQVALCCSGGGIRSATFCLGVIQAFANYDVSAGQLRGKAAAIARSNEPNADTHQAGAEQHRQVGEAAASKPAPYTPINPEFSALGRFHYLSTVSGGGYIGSWLSSWRSRSDYSTVINDLTSRRKGPDIEPPEISWLRAYSNYLTPQLGVASADGWAAVAILIRNLILNWLVIIPIVCLVLVLLKLTATVSVWFAHTVVDKRIIWFVILGAFFLVVEQSFTNRYRPPRRIANVSAGQGKFLGRSFIWAFLSAIFFTVFFSSRWFLQDLPNFVFAVDDWLGLTAIFDWINFDLKLRFFASSAIGGALIYAIGWIAALRFRSGWSDFFRWAASGLVYGALVGLGVYLFLQLQPYPATSKNVCLLLVSVVLGVPWILMAQLVGEVIFVGLASDELNADADREWLGRAAGWLAAGATTWAILAFLVFAGGYLVEDAVELGHQTLVKAGGVAGVISAIVTAVLGGSGKTPAKSSSDDQGSVTAVVSNVVLALAGPIFAAVLIVVLSATLDKLLVGGALAAKMQLIGGSDDHASTSSILWWLVIGLAIVAVVGFLASYFVNINRFSLHALYRNRLTRCYLGASNQARKPDKFSGFDFDDNMCVHRLWPPKSGGGVNSSSLFHVVNIALNVVSTKRLAWQERKAESFTVSPLHCGSAYLGFRESWKYGGKSKTDDKNDSGLSLGTAMAISGAAVSPNMGYHSSPSIALLLTLFNVRLGWWLGNPGKAGKKTYTEEGPKWAAVPLFSEAFGWTTDQNRYVYLSDGGHFENLGLYEMVRRRCRLIVVIDAGCDPDFAFEDLGNAVRKIYIDLGIRITFRDLGSLTDRPSSKSRSRDKRDAAALATIQAARRLEKMAEEEEQEREEKHKAGKGDKIAAPGEPPYHAVGIVHYKEADHPKDDGEIVENGYILYIKPAYHGSEKNAGIRSYATANPTFPHETTADQWFTESQLESYRSLGLEIASHILNHEVELRAADAQHGRLTLQDALRRQPATPPAAPSP